MFLPYLNYTQPMSLCILGLSKTQHATLDGVNYVGLGQRSLATYPFYTVYDRESNTAKIELGGAVSRQNAGTNFVPAIIAIAIVVILVVMVVYLIALRSMRIKAEEWLEKNRHILFSHANKLKTEGELLDSILNSPKLEAGGQGALDTPQMRKSVPSAMKKDAGSNLLNYEQEGEQNVATPRMARAPATMGNLGYDAATPNAKSNNGPFTFDD